MKSLILALAILLNTTPASAKILCTTQGAIKSAALEVVRDLLENGQLASELAVLSNGRTIATGGELSAAEKNRIYTEIAANLRFNGIQPMFASQFNTDRTIVFELDCMGRWSIDFPSQKKGGISTSQF